MSDFWSFESIVKRQAEQPVFLTNGIGESTIQDTDVGVAVAHRFDFAFSVSPRNGGGPIDCKAGSRVLGPEKVDFYPLTVAESKLAADLVAKGPFGGAEMPYAALYKGVKYFAPTFEVMHRCEQQPKAEGDYGDFPTAFYASRDAAHAEAMRFRDWLAGKRWKGLLPYHMSIDVYVTPNDGPTSPSEDRFDILFLVPMAWPRRIGPRPFDKPDGFKAWLEEWFAGYEPADPGISSAARRSRLRPFRAVIGRSLAGPPFVMASDSLDVWQSVEYGSVNLRRTLDDVPVREEPIGLWLWEGTVDHSGGPPRWEGKHRRLANEEIPSMLAMTPGVES